MKLLGIHANDDELETIFEEFDTDKTFKLNYEEFEEAILGEKPDRSFIDLLKKIKKGIMEKFTSNDPTT